MCKVVNIRCTHREFFIISFILVLLMLITTISTPVFANDINSDSISTSQSAPESAKPNKPINIDYSESGNIFIPGTSAIKEKEIVILMDSSSNMASTIAPPYVKTAFDYGLYAESAISLTGQSTTITGKGYTKGDVTLSGENASGTTIPVNIDEILYGGTANTAGLGTNNIVKLTQTNELIDMPQGLFDSLNNDATIRKYTFNSSTTNTSLTGQSDIWLNKNTISSPAPGIEWQFTGGGYFNLAGEVDGKLPMYYFEDNVKFNQAQGVIGNGIIVAKGDITLDGYPNALNGNIFVYSVNGNITVTNSNYVKGVLYAPNGTVILQGGSANIIGGIACKNFEDHVNTTTITKSSISYLTEKINVAYTQSLLNIAKTSAKNFINQYNDISGKNIKVHLIKYSKDANNNDYSIIYDIGTQTGRTNLLTDIDSITPDTQYANLGDGLRRAMFTLSDTNKSNKVLVFSSGNILGWSSTNDNTTMLTSDGNAAYYGGTNSNDTTKALDYAKSMASSLMSKNVTSYFINLSADATSTNIAAVAATSHDVSLTAADYSYAFINSTHVAGASKGIYKHITQSQYSPVGTMEVTGAYFYMSYPKNVQVSSITNNSGLTSEVNSSTGNYEVKGYLERENGTLIGVSAINTGSTYRLKGDKATITTIFTQINNYTLENGYIKYELKYTDISGNITLSTATKVISPSTICITDELLEIIGSNSICVADVIQLQLHNTLTGKIYPNVEITWSSSNEKIASIDGSGIITGRKAGKIILTATVKGIPTEKEMTVYTDIF